MLLPDPWIDSYSKFENKIESILINKKKITFKNQIKKLYIINAVKV